MCETKWVKYVQIYLVWELVYVQVGKVVYVHITKRCTLKRQNIVDNYPIESYNEHKLHREKMCTGVYVVHIVQCAN